MKVRIGRLKTKIQTERKWRIVKIFFAPLILFISKSLYLFIFGVMMNWFIRNPKKIITDKIWANVFSSLKQKNINKPESIRPKLNNLGKNILKKFLVSSVDKTLKTTGETRTMNEIIVPNKVAARKLIIMLFNPL